MHFIILQKDLFILESVFISGERDRGEREAQAERSTEYGDCCGVLSRKIIHFKFNI